MRFERLNKNSIDGTSLKQNIANRLIFIAYNVIWWIPIVLAVFKIIDLPTAFIAFFLITLFRAAANLYRNNLLDPAQVASFPLRSP